MGLTPEPPLPHEHGDPGDAADGATQLLDDLAAYALDAVDLEEAVTIEALLATDPAAARIERDLRDASGELALALHPAEDADADAAARSIRARVLSTAHAARPPVAIDPASAIEVHRIELERLVMLLGRLTDEQWARPLDPPEFAGWTVKDLAAHLASNEGNAVQVLGLEHPVLPETINDNEARTEQVLARHRTMSNAETLAELEACFRAVDERVTALGAEGIEEDIEWWGMQIRILTMLIVRSFETWTHADDIRRAVGFPQLPPPATSLACMSQVASNWAPMMMLTRGLDLQDTSIELRLTGLGGGTHHLNLGFGEIDLTTHEPAAVVTIDVLDYCRIIGDRLAPADARYEATGDLELARTYIGVLDALATL
jgi:uncharacterized protein (TIGR03083 family)